MRCFTASLTAVVAYSRDFTMSSPIAGVPLNRAADVGSAAPAVTLATWPSVMSAPLCCATTRAAKSSGRSNRPWRRIERCSSGVLTLPTGAARFCARSAVTI